MIQAYAIGVDLVMDPRKVLGPLGQVLDGFERLMKAQRDAQAGLNEFAAGIRAAAKATDSLAQAWRNVASATQAAAAAAKASAAAAAAASGAPAAAGPRVSSGPRLALMPAPLLLAAPPSGGGMTVTGGGFFGGGGGGGGTGIGRWGTPVWPNGAGGGGGPGLVPFGGGGGGGFGMPPLTVPPLGGGGGAGGGLSMASLSRAWYGIELLDQVITSLGRLVEAGAGFNDQLARLQQRGVTSAQIGGVESAVFSAAQNVPGVSLEKATRDVGALRAVLGLSADNNGPDALNIVNGQLQHYEMVSAALAASTGTSSEAAMDMLSRAVEVTGGAMDPKTGKLSAPRFSAALDAAYRALMVVAPVGKANDLLRLAQQGSLIAKTMDPADFFAMMQAAVLDQGGSRSGTSLQAIGRAWYGGVVSKKVAQEMERVGMVPEGSYEVTGGANGGRLSKNAINHLDEQIAAAGGVFGYVDKVLRPLLEAKGITSPDAQTKEIFTLLPTDTARRLVSLFLEQADQVTKEIVLNKNVPSPEAALAIAGKSNIMFNLQAMETSFTNFLETVEKVNAPVVIDVLNHVREFFDFWSKVVEKDIGGMPKGAPGGAYSYTVPGIMERMLKTFGIDLGTGTSTAPESNIHRESFRPGGSGGAVHLRGDIIMDGKKVGSVIAASMAGAFSAAPRGAASFDGRTLPALQAT